MTTITFDGRYIAVDSRISQTSGHISSDNHNKTYETPEWVIFWSGALHTKDDFINAFLYSCDYLHEEYNGIYAFEKHSNNLFEVWHKDKKLLRNKITEPDATGSGGDHAITAMDCGKSAVDAVKLAAKRDSCTGGIIRCYDTYKKKFIKVKQ